MSLPLALWFAVLVSGADSAAGGSGKPIDVSDCVHSSSTITSADYSRLAREKRDKVVATLDRIRDKVEEWGAVTISAPVAVLDESAFYVPDNIVSPSQLYIDAKSDVSASATQATETGVSNQLGAVATPMLIAKVGQPSPGGTTTSTATTTSTVPPLIGADGKPRASLNSEDVSVPNKAGFDAFSATTATAPFNLAAGTPPPQKGVTAALREAQDNTMRQKIYSQMSHPKDIVGYNHVLFAIVQVSCNPGWRTQEHYIADCSASLEYFDLCRKEHLPSGERRRPTVFSVLPLIDAQTVEMANSQRDVTQLAFQLAASLPARGVDLKAKDLFEFVKRYSRDLRSRTPIPVVNSYSSGGTFGFRFSPSFQAMRDPAQKNARAANVLLPTSFPALITVVIHQVDLDYYKDIYKPKMPGILTHISTRWYLKDRLPLWQFPKRLFTPMRRDTAAMEINAAEDVATIHAAKEVFKDQTSGAEGTQPQAFNPALEEMRREVLALQEKGVGRDWPIPINETLFSAKARKDHENKDNLLRENARLKEENAQLKAKAKSASNDPADSAVRVGESQGGSDGNAEREAFSQRFGMSPVSGLAATGMFGALPPEVAWSSLRAPARRASLRVGDRPATDDENPLLPPLPER